MSAYGPKQTCYLNFSLGLLARFLGCALFRRGAHKPIKTVKTLILFLYKAAISHCFGSSRNLFGCWRYFFVIAVQAFLALIFNRKAGPQCLQWNLRHRESLNSSEIRQRWWRDCDNRFVGCCFRRFRLGLHTLDNYSLAYFFWTPNVFL